MHIGEWSPTLQLCPHFLLEVKMDDLTIFTAKQANRLSSASNEHSFSKATVALAMQKIKEACLEGETDVWFSVYEFENPYESVPLMSFLLGLKYEVNFFGINDNWLWEDPMPNIFNNRECQMKISW